MTNTIQEQKQDGPLAVEPPADADLMPPMPGEPTGLVEPIDDDGGEMPLASFMGRAPLYYDHLRGLYWTEDTRKKYISINEASVKRELKSLGYKVKAEKGEQISEVERELLEIQKRHNVSYAGPLAGYDAGLYNINGAQVLVTDSPKIIEPVEGGFPMLRMVIDGLFEGQVDYFYSWIKLSVESLRQRKWVPSQALIMSGPVGCGKSLLQGLITKMLGGRSANPYKFMLGLTEFNSNLFYGEHLMVEDQIPTTDPRRRNQMAATLKAFCVNKNHDHHAKFCNKLELTPWWRVTITCNSDGESIMSLPTFNESLADKAIVLSAHMKPMPMPVETPDQQKQFMAVLDCELPAFLYWLLNHYQIPQKIRAARYGMAAWQNPEIVSDINETSNEMFLLRIIDAELFKFPNSPEWEGSSHDLERLLLASDHAYDTRKVLKDWANACGTYLGKILWKMPHRIKRRKIDGYSRWTILPPNNEPF